MTGNGFSRSSDAVTLLVAALGDVPLIGFAGAPFTLASYLIEGGPSRHHARTKAMMLAEPDSWHALMEKLTDITVGFLRAQLEAGVDAIQVFDSWAGALSLADYRAYVQPHSARVFAALAEYGVPMTHFGVGTAELLGAMSTVGATVVGVDWRTSLADAATRVAPGTALQGNLDPVVLHAGWPVVERAARAVVDDGRRAIDAGASRPRLQPWSRRAAGDRSRRADRPGVAGPLPMTTRSYCVVGGGISGLTAAYRLRAAVGDDAAITLFEPGDRLGGILRTELVGGQTMDLGAEAFVLRRPEMPALLAELGLSGRQLVSTGARPLIYSQRKLHPLPTGTVVGIPSSAASVAGLVDEATVARIDAEPGRPLDWRPGSDPAAAELVGDRFGEQVVARSVDPLLSGVYAGSAATIGLRAAAPGVAAALDRGATSLTDAVRQALPPATGAPVFGALDGGYQVLLNALVERGRPRWVRAAVQRLDPAGPGWTLLDDTGARWHADAVILAVPARGMARLVADVAPSSAAAASRITSASSVVVALAVPGNTPFPECSGVLVATGERLRGKAITLSSRKWGARGDTPAAAAVVRSVR